MHDRDAIPATIPRISRTPRRVEHRPMLNCEPAAPNLIWRRQNRKYLQVTTKAKFGIVCAYFDVGRCSTRLSVLENLGITAGIASLSCIQPKLKVLPVSSSQSQIRYRGCTFRCQSMFQSSGRPRKPRSIRRNRVSILLTA